MSKRRFAAYPAAGTITISNGDEYPIPRGGTFINVKTADQPFKIVLDGTDTISAAANRRFTFNEEAAFKDVMVVNDSGSDLTFQLEIGYGKVESDDVSITGTVNVDTGADIVSGSTDALRVYDGNNLDIEDVLKGKDLADDFILQKGAIDLSNVSHFTQSGVTSGGSIVTAGANTDGVIVRTFCLNSQGTNGEAILKMDGNRIYEARGDNDGPAQVYGNTILVPAGSALTADTNGSGDRVTVSYEVL